MRAIKNVIGASGRKKEWRPTHPLRVSDLGATLLSHSRNFIREDITEEENAKLINYQERIHNNQGYLAQLPKNLSVSVVRNVEGLCSHHVLYTSSLTLHYGKTINSTSKVTILPVSEEKCIWNPEWEVHAKCAKSLYSAVTSMLQGFPSLEISKFRSLGGYCNSDITYFDRFGREFTVSPKSIPTSLPRINSTTALERIGYDTIFRHLCEPINDLFRQSIEKQILVVGDYCKEHDEIYQDHFAKKGKNAYMYFTSDLYKCLSIVGARCGSLQVPFQDIAQFVNHHRKELVTLNDVINNLDKKAFFTYHLSREAGNALNDLMYDRYKRADAMRIIPALDLVWLSAAMKLLSPRIDLKTEVVYEFVQKVLNSKDTKGKLEFVM